jgi:hypothetical protein
MKITKAIRRKLGTLVGLADQTVAKVIRARGGVAANAREAGLWAEKTPGEPARSAVEGDPEAASAIKIAKQARRLGEKYGGDSS